MQTIDAGGQPLSLALFIKAYKAARKLAPARFLTLRIHPEMFERLNCLHAEMTEIVQVGEMIGHLGKRITRIACVPAPNGLGDGVIVNQDKECEPSELEFQVHGAAELKIVNMYYDAGIEEKMKKQAEAELQAEEPETHTIQ